MDDTLAELRRLAAQASTAAPVVLIGLAFLVVSFSVRDE